VRQFIDRIVRRLWQPSFRVDAPPAVEVVLRRKGPQTIVHLCNAANMQVAAEYSTTDYIPAAGPVSVSLKLPRPPKRVMLMPEDSPVQGTWNGGEWTGVIPGVPIHAAVVFE
jgi:hypothetical protein